jgi:hypothetical protein
MTVQSPQGMHVQSPHGMMGHSPMRMSDVPMSQDYSAQMDYSASMMPSMQGCMPSAGSLPASTTDQMSSPAHLQMGQHHANCPPHWDYRPVDLDVKLAPSVYSSHMGEKGRTDELTISTESGATSQVGDSPDTSRRVSNDNSLDRALQDLSCANVQRTADHIVFGAPTVLELTKAVESRAIADPSQTAVLADLLAHINGRLDVGTECARLCSESVAALDDRASMNRMRGVALLAAELFNRNIVQMSVMKEVFQKLVFSGVVVDNGVRASCDALAVAGARLEQTPVGSKMIDLLLMRLKEIRPGKYAPATRSAMVEVEHLRNNGWASTESKDAPSSRGPRDMGTPKRSKEEAKAKASPSTKSPCRFSKDAQSFVPKGKGGGKGSPAQRPVKR